MSKFGDIPDHVLDIDLITIEEFDMTLREMIDDVTDDDIEEARYIVSMSDDDFPLLETFRAWTKNSILVLQYNPMGYYMDCYDRNPPKTSTD